MRTASCTASEFFKAALHFMHRESAVSEDDIKPFEDDERSAKPSARIGHVPPHDFGHHTDSRGSASAGAAQAVQRQWKL